MSDLDTLIVTFQTQLSDVMETIVKTAMYEVTRLVEDGFMEEVRRRNQEMESLRTQLQWAERKLSDQGEKEGGKTGRCVDCGKDDVELSPDVAERSTELQYDILRGCGLKEEGDSVERWTRSCRQEVVSEPAQDIDKPTPILSPARESQTVEDGVMPAVDVKEEEVDKPSCSAVQPGGWAVSCDGEAESESHSSSEMTDTQPKQTQQNSEELLRNVIKQDLQSSTAYVFPEDQEDTHMVTDPSHVSPLEMDSKWAGRTLRTTGLLQKHALGTDKDCETAITKGSLKRMDHKLVDPATADEVLAIPQLVRDQISSSGSPKARQISDVESVVIKQEVIVDSDGDEEEEEVEEREMTRSETVSFSCSVNQHRVRSQVLKQNHISSKPTVQEVMKLHSKVGTSLTLQAAVQHLRRPMKRPPHTLSNNTSTAPPMTHSRVANLNPLNRIPSTSKAAPPPPPPPLSVQRAHLGDKQAAAFTRTGAPWVSIKSHHQTANSHHPHPHPHPGSHPQPGPRHLLRCGQCGKCFPHPSNLKAHLQTHTGERPFCCSLCGRSFTKLSNLKAHRRVHTGERPYCCLACGKRFTQKCNLKRHQRIHLDV
ncbi:uncharacterized protein [Centroberyx affinis]|uniref:uncharacterized protein n=1 Tax=Centroberyx affinis TaxID=166261 RepID=UPI003A5B9DFC